MIEVVLVVICAIGLYASWSMIKYNKQIKEHERDNQKRATDGEKKKYKSKRSAKVSKDQVSNKRKYNNAKKKAIESKVKKNAGRNKKKV
jgi:Flp pilus assembly protein TadB